MRPRVGTVACCALIAVGVARGQSNTIRLWWSDQPGNCILDQTNRRARIIGPGTFKLDAVSFGMLGVIDKIYTDPNIAGTVLLYVQRDPNVAGPDQPGATQVKEIDLTGASEGNIVVLRCTSHVGAIAPVRATRIRDACQIGGSVLHDIVLSGSIDCPLNITGFLRANLTCSSLHNLTVSGLGIAPTTTLPTITITGGGYAHAMSVNQTVEKLTLNGDAAASASIQFTNYADL